MTQTAVEWLENQIMTSKYFYKVLEDINSRSTIAQPNIFRQAKTMEKEQIIKAYDKGEFDQGCNGDAEQYYNETKKD
jgi:hypothetical protein